MRSRSQAIQAAGSAAVPGWSRSMICSARCGAPASDIPLTICNAAMAGLEERVTAAGATTVTALGGTTVAAAGAACVAAGLALVFLEVLDGAASAPDAVMANRRQIAIWEDRRIRASTLT